MIEIKKSINGIKRKTGYIAGNIYYTHRDLSNIFRKYDGFGFSVSILNELTNLGINNIGIFWSGLTLYTDMNMISASGVSYNDYGDKQIVLKRDCFIEREPGIKSIQLTLNSGGKTNEQG